MKVLYIIKRDPDATAQGMIEQHQQEAEVSIIDIRQNKDYASIVEQVFSNDKVICW